MSKKHRLEKQKSQKNKQKEVTGVTDSQDTDGSKDRSQHVHQGEKISFDLNIRDFPWTEKQKVFIEAALDKDTNYILCEAPPGVGKTLLSIYIGLRMLQSRRIGTIYFVRSPIESSSRGLGFLSGDLNQKFDVYIQPMMDQLHELLPPSQVRKLIEDGHIQSIPLGFVKGRTFNASLIVADEAEDLLRSEVLLIMGRLGKYAKMILIGDNDQTNIRESGFLSAYQMFDDEESREQGIYCFRFDINDIMRNGVIGYVVKKFKGIY